MYMLVIWLLVISICLPPSGVLDPVAKEINKPAEASGSRSTLVQISVIVISGEAGFKWKREGRGWNYSDLSTVGDAAVYIIVYITFPGGWFSNGSSAVCRKSAWKASQLRLKATFSELWTD